MAASFLSCRRVDARLEQSFVSARGSWTQRALLMLELGDGTGRVGRGEASPLPGYSPDDLADCERALSALQRLSPLTASQSVQAVFERIDELIPRALPAARFGLETAVLDLLGRRLERPLWSLLAQAADAGVGEGLPGELALCAVLPSDDSTAALGLARRRSEAGVRAFKLKVGPDVLRPAQEQTLEALREAFGASVELRVDANQSFARRSLVETCERLARYAPSFIEEPIEAPLAAELERLPCGFALDESLAGSSLERVSELIGASSCRALVLKPTLLGGFGRCVQLANLARARGRSVVVSHTLEGPVGFAACVHLALGLRSDAAHGLCPLPHQAPGSQPALPRPTDFAAPGLGVPA